MADSEVVERRREPRYRLNKMLGLELDGEEYSAHLRVFVLDLSATGMRLTSPEQIPPHESLKFALRLPDKRRVHGSCAVRWQNLLASSGNYDLGVEFLELAEEDWRILREFVGTLLAQPEKRQEELARPWNLGNRF